MFYCFGFTSHVNFALDVLLPGAVSDILFLFSEIFKFCDKKLSSSLSTLKKVLNPACTLKLTLQVSLLSLHLCYI